VTEFRDAFLEQGELPGLLLFQTFVVQAQDCFIHDPGQMKDRVDLVLRWHTLVLILQGNSDLGFEEFFLFVRLLHYIFSVSKPVSKVKEENHSREIWGLLFRWNCRNMYEYVRLVRREEVGP
jgi:hypothetical protein